MLFHVFHALRLLTHENLWQPFYRALVIRLDRAYPRHVQDQSMKDVALASPGPTYGPIIINGSGWDPKSNNQSESIVACSAWGIYLNIDSIATIIELISPLLAAVQIQR